jgi:NADH dehydrogenase
MDGALNANAPRDYDALRGDAGERKHVVIVGGGFAGLYAALSLGRAPVDVTIVDRTNHHLFQPLLYQVATAALSAPDVASPIRRILKDQRNARVLLDEVVAVDKEARRLVLAAGRLSYDVLLLAPGSRDHWFGNDEWKRHAPGLKTIDDALGIRARVLAAFEAAEREPDPAVRAEWLTFAVVGGGPTGVELAGSLAEIARRTLTRNFRNFDPKDARVVLLEGGPRLLPVYPEESSAAAKAQLERLGAQVRLGARVTALDGEGVTYDGERLACRTVLWAAGQRGSPLLETLAVPLDRSGRVMVRQDLTVEGHPELMVLGDAAAVPRFAGSPDLVPGVAPAAIQMGRHAATNVLRSLRGEPALPFVYRDKGSLATIGRKSAVADFGKLRFAGTVAWLLWLFVHVLFLIGFRNRIAVLFEWAIAYFTYQRSARVILTRNDGRSGS